MSERFSIWFVCMGRARIHLIRLTQAENRVTFNQPIKLIWSTTFFFLCVCFLSLCLFFSVYLIFFPLKHVATESPLCLQGIYRIHLAIYSIVWRAYQIYATAYWYRMDQLFRTSLVESIQQQHMYLYRFSAMFCLPIMYNNATTFPAHSENFNLKNANC